MLLKSYPNYARRYPNYASRYPNVARGNPILPRGPNSPRGRRREGGQDTPIRSEDRVPPARTRTGVPFFLTPCHPWQRIPQTWYPAGGMPLADTQEDFLVWLDIFYIEPAQTNLSSAWPYHRNINWKSLADLVFSRVRGTDPKSRGLAYFFFVIFPDIWEYEWDTCHCITLRICQWEDHLPWNSCRINELLFSYFSSSSALD